jgi:hypothetical protein
MIPPSKKALFLPAAFLLAATSCFARDSFFDVSFDLKSAAAYTSNLPGWAGHREDLFATHSSLTISAIAALSDTLHANAIISADHIYDVFLKPEKGSIGDGFKFYNFPGGEDEDFSVRLVNAAILWRPGIFTFSAGRQFYGKPNQLTPYYGPYPQSHLLRKPSSVDGLLAEADWDFFKLSLFAGKENEAPFSAGDNDLFFAEADFTPFDFWRISSGMYSLLTNDYLYYKKRNIIMFNFATNFSLGKSVLSLAYGANGGEFRFSFPDEKWSYKGSAALIKLNTRGTSSYGEHDSRIMVFRGSGGTRTVLSSFQAPHSFINMGAIFSGVIAENKYLPLTIYYPSPIEGNNITVFNIGQSLTVHAFPLKLDVDLFSISNTAPLYDWDKELGTEVDVFATYNFSNGVYVKAGYALFIPGLGFKQKDGMQNAPNISQVSLALGVSF